jgi:hypothetical protein
VRPYPRRARDSARRIKFSSSAENFFPRERILCRGRFRLRKKCSSETTWIERLQIVRLFA